MVSLAQAPNPTVTLAATPAEANAIALYPSGVPLIEGAPKRERWDTIGPNLTLRNVVSPTLTPYLPTKGTATGAAVIVAPGGGFMMLAIQNEGWEVAQWLADHGIAAFVLKYRVHTTPEDEAEFSRLLKNMLGRTAPGTSTSSSGRARGAFAPAVQDGIAALRLVHSKAAEWGVNPNRIGMIGFSAGAELSLAVGTGREVALKPAFIGLFYGPGDVASVPADAPPLFAAAAADDPLVNSESSIAIIQAWLRAKRPAELHLYQTGGHGFGLAHHGNTTDLWPEEFRAWLSVNGWIRSDGGH
jgi:acetyl esterase/lipase